MLWQILSSNPSHKAAGGGEQKGHRLGWGQERLQRDGDSRAEAWGKEGETLMQKHISVHQRENTEC